MDKQPQDSTTILDTIKEHTTNLEHIVTGNHVNAIIADALQEFGPRERATRESAITIEGSPESPADDAVKLIEEQWISQRGQAPVTFWKDKNFTYAQFINKQTKEVFLEYIKTKPDMKKMMDMILKPNSDGQHITRKEVRLVISGVPESVDETKLEDTLKALSGPGATINQVRAGKPYGNESRKVKSIMLNANAAAFKLIFKAIGGSIPYNHNQNKMRLFPKVACKPWACRECYFIGPNHSCQGRTCGQCGKSGHITKDCKSKTRYCSNCKRPGHRARDAHCPVFVREVIKELKRMDFPLEFLESKQRRFELLKSLSYK